MKAGSSKRKEARQEGGKGWLSLGDKEERERLLENDSVKEGTRPKIRAFLPAAKN